jgi:branched-chain amino acid transport system ATP-binding protein
LRAATETSGAPALEVHGLTAGYAGVPALRDFELSLAPGEVLTLLGANGAGKTTALLAIVGAITPIAGRVTSFGEELTGRRIEEIARLGVGLVPDNRGIFFELTVAEHLRLARAPDGSAAREEALDRFPQLRPLMGRRCGLLSGGEQQMLALAKTLVSRPRVLLIDEMSLGLAPLVVQRLLPVIRELAQNKGTAVVLVEQHVELALRVSDQAMVLNRGRLTLVGRATELREDRTAVEGAYFGEPTSVKRKR